MTSSRMPLTVALSIVSVLGAFLAAAPSATAGRYRVWACKTPTGEIAPTDGFVPESSGNAVGSISNDCVQGSVMRATLDAATGQPASARLGWHYTAPPDTEIAYFDLWRSITTVQSPNDSGSATPGQYTSWPTPNYSSDAREACTAASGCTSRGVHTSAVVDQNVWYSGPLSGARDVYFSVGCVPLYACASRPGSNPMADLRIQAVSLALLDTTDPAVSNIGGSLAADEPHSGTQSIEFHAEDTGAGLYESFVDVRKPGESDFTNMVRVPVDLNSGKCAELDYYPNDNHEFGYGVPCKLSVAEEVPFDTTRLLNGDYELRVRIEDASGNSATVVGPQEFTVDNGPRFATSTSSAGLGIGIGPVNNGANASRKARLHAIGASGRSLAYGRSTQVGLELRDEQGQVISGAHISVLQRMNVPGAVFAPARRDALTDQDGRVRLTLPPGYSRKVRFTYASSVFGATYEAKADVNISVRSKMILRESRAFLRNGQTLRFSGRLQSRPVPRHGVLIDLQARVRSHWQTFNTSRTTSRGRWRAKYRFRATTGLQTYRFRAKVRADTGFPYAPSVSNHVKVRVRG